MIFALGLITIGYAIFYWGLHHFINPRYSLWCVLGTASLSQAAGVQLTQPKGPFGLS